MDVKLWQDKRQTEMYGIFVELYAITEATEELEKAYVRDIIFSASGYATDCLKLVYAQRHDPYHPLLCIYISIGLPLCYMEATDELGNSLIWNLNIIHPW